MLLLCLSSKTESCISVKKQQQKMSPIIRSLSESWFLTRKEFLGSISDVPGSKGDPAEGLESAFLEAFGNEPLTCLTWLGRQPSPLDSEQ